MFGRRGMITAALAAMTLTGGGARAGDMPPWVGVWECQVGTFVFTAETYNPGDQLLVAATIEPDGDNYVWTFADGYQIGLSGITEDTMQWLSFESGDSFDCTRIAY